MFTGLVEALGVVRGRAVPAAGSDGEVLTVAAPFAAELTLGESVAINGACLTVVASDAECCRFEVGPETLRRTNLGALNVGDRVNLERSLRLSDRLGGHLVQGHVDDVGAIQDRRLQGDWAFVWFACSQALAAQMVPKGSVAVDGISLTLVEVQEQRFSVALIPHTLGNTTLGLKGQGDLVNLETDILAKYAWKVLLTLSQGTLTTPETGLQEDGTTPR
jgi:riboflavin synthase